MTITHNKLFAKLAVTVAVFAAGLVTFMLVNHSSSPTGQTGHDLTGASASDRYDLLGDNFLQKVRETGDASYYKRAGTAYSKALRLNPNDHAAVTGAGTLAVARHDFRAGLRYGLRARELAPYSFEPLGVLVDAQVELGRYHDAARSLQRMVDLKPNLSSYARVSYFRELHGDLPGAIEAMKLAVSAGGGTAENVAYVQTLLGNLYFDSGRVDDARHAYRTALGTFPSYVPATAGLANVSPLGGALRLYRDGVARLPLPQYVIALGERKQAAGLRPAYALVRAEERL